MLNFCNVPPPHNKVTIADALQKCFQNCGIENKISTVTIDNTNANDAGIMILEMIFV